MELTESIRSRAHRTLKQRKNFLSGDQAAIELAEEVQFAVLPNEELLGIYKNSYSDPHLNLIFTTRGVYRFDGQWRCIKYDNLADVRLLQGENFEKQTADTLLISYKDGSKEELTISGANVNIISGYERRYPDIYEVLRFFSRVLKRINQERSF